MMQKKRTAINAILKQRMLPLYYHDDAVTSVGILKALYNAGVRIVEYTNRGKNALDNFAIMRKEVDGNMPGLLLGIGTIKTKQQAKDFLHAGADFIVCPTTNVEVAEQVGENILWIPGCMTPTEIAVAESAGATLVKIFPGNLLGPSFINGVKELFPGISFMPTGGVETEENNLQSWFKAGVVAVGMGSKLLSKEMIDTKDFSAITEAAKNALELVRRAAV